MGTETVKVNLKEVGSGAGKLDFTGSGIEGFTCSDKTYTKSGTELTLSDASDCLPSNVEVTRVLYCSDNDQVQVTVKDSVVPLPITAPSCYRGSAGALGLKETV